MSAAGGATPWPVELRLISAEQVLEVDFDDGRSFRLPAEYLRVESPSAEVQGHRPEQKRIVLGKRAVKIVAIDRVGHYAVRLRFDDGHDTGLYSWQVLRELGETQAEKQAAYAAAVAALQH